MASHWREHVLLRLANALQAEELMHKPQVYFDMLPSN
jgi:hypothetical protein